MKKLGKITKTGFEFYDEENKFDTDLVLVMDLDTSEFKKGDVLYLDPNNPGGFKTMSKLELLKDKLRGLKITRDYRGELVGEKYKDTLESTLNELNIAWIKLKISIIEIFTFK